MIKTTTFRDNFVGNMFSFHIIMAVISFLCLQSIQVNGNIWSAFDDNDCYDSCYIGGRKVQDYLCDQCEEKAAEASCFPGDSVALLEGGMEKSMQHLRVGDVVITNQNGNLEKTQILGFLDKKKNNTGKYLNLVTEDGHSLFISDRHVMFIKDDTAKKSVLAQDVKTGDEIFVNSQNGFSTVKEITVSHKTGAYVPLTSAGTLLVDGVLVSSYTNVDHYLAHKLATPVRWWPSLLLDNEKSQDEEGIRTVPWIIREVATVLGLATRAEAKTDKIQHKVFGMSQLAMANMGKSEF